MRCDICRWREVCRIWQTVRHLCDRYLDPELHYRCTQFMERLEPALELLPLYCRFFTPEQPEQKEQAGEKP